MRPGCTIDLQKHFAKPDFKAEKLAMEKEEHRKLIQKEKNTTVGAVMRLIQKVSSNAVSANLIQRLDDPISDDRK
jgi:hypothetical protein